MSSLLCGVIDTTAPQRLVVLLEQGLPSPSTTEDASKIKKSHFVRLMLKVAAETAQALLEGRYRQFDALIKNFGCQITALQVYEKVQNPQILLEAERVLAVAKEALNKKPHPCNLAVSEGFCELVRLRILAIVNTNKFAYSTTGEIQGEVPITSHINLEPLAGIKTHLQQLVDALQIEESHRAATFIRSTAERIAGDRGEVIRLALSSEASFKKVVSVPNMHNTEAVLHSFNGILLLKNKVTYFDSTPTSNPTPEKVAMKMPEEQILSAEEYATNPTYTPLLIIEGYLKQSGTLAALVMQVGVIALTNANCAILPQFAGKNQPSLPNMVVDDISNFVNLETVAAFKIDHIYCASKQEEEES